VADQVTAGSGTVYSWVRVHRALSDAPVVEPPYVVATVELDDGCRLFGRIEPQELVAIGMPVSPGFIDHGPWTELVFVPGPEQ
jgi:hypothetical protein